MICAEYRLPKNTVSDVGTNFMSEIFKYFCRKVNIQQTITSSYYHKSNEQVEACIKFISIPLKCFDTNRDKLVALLQMHSTLIGAGLMSTAMMLFNRPIRDMWLQMNRDPHYCK